MRIVPAAGRTVRDPETLRVVGAEGLTVDPTDLYWHRLLLDRDVEEALDLSTEELVPDAVEAPQAAIATPSAESSEEHVA